MFSSALRHDGCAQVTLAFPVLNFAVGEFRYVTLAALLFEFRLMQRDSAKCNLIVLSFSGEYVRVRSSGGRTDHVLVVDQPENRLSQWRSCWFISVRQALIRSVVGAVPSYVGTTVKWGENHR